MFVHTNHDKSVGLSQLNKANLRKGAIISGLSLITLGGAWFRSQKTEPPVPPIDQQAKMTRLLESEFSLISVDKGVSLIKKGTARRVDEVDSNGCEFLCNCHRSRSVGKYAINSFSFYKIPSYL